MKAWCAKAFAVSLVVVGMAWKLAFWCLLALSSARLVLGVGDWREPLAVACAMVFVSVGMARTFTPAKGG